MLDVDHDSERGDAGQPRREDRLYAEPRVLPPPPVAREQNKAGTEHWQSTGEDEHCVADVVLV